MRRRSLALVRETLTELATSDLAGVVGAQVPTTTATPTLNIKYCLISTLPCGGPPGSQVQCAGQ
jgi:hypothetical protein